MLDAVNAGLCDIVNCLVLGVIQLGVEGIQRDKRPMIDRRVMEEYIVRERERGFDRVVVVVR
jgi:hypothetical protein